MEFCILDTVTTNCDNFGRLFGARRKTPRRQSRPLLVAWTTATRCATAVQNAAARFVMGTRRCDHISPVLCQLHWLPVRQRVVFKIATLAHQSLSGNAPGYLADDCQLVADACVRQLRSADTRTLVVSRTRSSFGAGPLPQQDHESGTVCRPISYYVGCHTVSSGGYWSHFIRTVKPRRSVNFFNCAE